MLKKPDWFEQNEDKALSLLLDYYNLRLQISEEDGKLTLSDKEFKKITTFFVKHNWMAVSVPITGKDFDEIFPPPHAHPDINFAFLKQLHDAALQESDDKKRQLKFNQLDAQLTGHGIRSGRLDAVESVFYRAMWRETEGFQEFLSDYQRIAAIVKDAIEKEILSPDNVRWIETFGAKVTLTPRLSHKPKTKNLRDYWKCYTENSEIDLKKAGVIEFPNFPHKWYGLDFGRFVHFIYKGLLRLLDGEVAIKQCPISDCNTVFANEGRGRPPKFCSTSCYKRYHNEYNNLYMKHVKRAKPGPKGTQGTERLDWIKQEALKRC